MGKKICLAIHSLEPGGMERVMNKLAWYFSSKQNIEVHLILYGKERNVFYELPDQVMIHKPSFVFQNQYRAIYTLKTLWFLRNKIKEIKPHSVLSFGEKWNNLVLLALKGSSIPVYISDRANPQKRLSYLHEKFRQKIYPSATGIIVQTDIAGDVYRKKFPDTNITVIPNPINEIEPVNICGRKKTVLFVGRFISTKHIDRLIRMFVEVNPGDWKLDIIGGDHGEHSFSEKYGSLISKLGAQNSVRLLGFKKDVYTYYKRSSIFAFTSSSEGFPNVIGEALSAGLPVVAYDCVAGPAEMIVDGQNGYLVPLHDEKKFKEKLNQLMKNQALREKMSEKSILSVKKFHISKIGEKYYRTLMQGSK